MIFGQGRVLRKLTYSAESRRFVQNPDPAQKARIWPQIGVLRAPSIRTVLIAAGVWISLEHIVG